MRQPSSTRRYLPLAGLALSLQIPSVGVVERFLGLGAVIAYLVVSSLLVLLLDRFIVAGGIERIPARWALALTLATFAVVLAVHLVVYPYANSGFVGGGSDADDALDIAVRELVHLRFPYYARTYLDNLIGPFPGAMLLAVPFVLLGRSAYQNLFWLAVFHVVAARKLGDRRLALLLLWAMLALCPQVLYSVATGTDDLANSIYVFVFMTLLASPDSRPELRAWGRAAAAIALGIALSSRMNFPLLVPVLFGTLARTVGVRLALVHTALVGLTFVAVTAPFWLYDPAQFTPVQIQYGKVSQFDDVLPFAGMIIPAAAGSLSLLLASRYVDGSYVRLLASSAYVQALPVLVAVSLLALFAGAPAWIWAGYGVFSLPFAAVAASTSAWARPNREVSGIGR